jgi:phosphohistidine phosphatase
LKILYIVRHAKSGWDNPDLSDFERPLTARGRRNANSMSALISEQNDPPTLIVSSSALRAVTTARIFSENLGLPLESMVITNALYEATTRDTLDVVHAIDDAVDSAMVVGHNPTQTAFVNFLSDKLIDEMPTCAVAKLRFADAKRWNDITQKSGTLVLFEFPQKEL